MHRDDGTALAARSDGSQESQGYFLCVYHVELLPSKSTEAGFDLLMYISEWRLFILGFGKKTFNGGVCYCGLTVHRARWLLSGWWWPPSALPSIAHIFHKHMKTNSTENISFSPTGKAVPR